MTYSDLSQRMPDSPRSIGWRLQRFVLVALAAMAAFAAVAAPPAGAITDEEELTRFGSKGFGPGQFGAPIEIAADPVTGHIFVADQGNSFRIHEFTPWGNFVKAIGWDVAPGAVNEQQEVRVRAADGQFRLSFGASTTGDLDFDAPGGESEGLGSVEAALNALPSISGAGGDVSVEAFPGTPDGKSPSIYVVAFKGSLAATNVAELTIADGTTEPSGGIPSTSLEVRTRADGTASSTGLESCTAESGCKAGLDGSGAGQITTLPGNVAVDPVGNIYLKELGNSRVQKFDSAGRFLLMFGGEVNETTKESICTKAQLDGGDECGAGTQGTAPGQFSAGFSRGLALGAGGELFAADNERIQRFNLQGEFEAALPVPGEEVQSLAFDPVSGSLYATYSGENIVHKLDSITGNQVDEIKIFNGGYTVTTDSAGNLYTTGQIAGVTAVLQYDASGNPLSPPDCCKVGETSDGTAGLSGFGTNAIGNLYVSYTGQFDSFIRVFGPGPVTFEAAPKVPPTINTQFATSVNRTDAVLKAEINPHFWSDTRYYVEYGTGKCSEGGCGSMKPVAPGALLSSKVSDTPVQSAGIFLEGLEPGTTYHYRFVAQSIGGGPVRGIGGEVGVDGEESSFTTYPTPPPFKADCPNQAFRTGFSAPLTDCRAFEMVSPVDKDNGDIAVLPSLANYSTALSQSSASGDRFTYSSYRAFADPKAAPWASQYLANRDPESGWSSKVISPAQTTGLEGDSTFDNPFKAFSADLCGGWLQVLADPVLAPGATEGRRNVYRRDNCGDKGDEALIQVDLNQAEGGEFNGFFPVLQGASDDGDEAIVWADHALTGDAASGVFQAYYASGGELHLLCILPNGSPSGSNCSGGMARGLGISSMELFSSVKHAISSDGSKVYWTDSGAKGAAPGAIYLRLNPDQEQSEISGGECTEAEKACTVVVSGTATPKASRFLGASADGSKALFEVAEGAQEGSLYKYEYDAGESTLIAAKGVGVAGASENLSHVYFVSKEVLPETNGASVGKPNLYLDQEGAKTFIATLSAVDVTLDIEEQNISNTDPLPVFHAARVSPDGQRLAFISTESLTGYDNTDQATGKAVSEVYLYEPGAAGPVCVSCNPSGARPQAGVMRVSAASLPSAASLALPLNLLHSPRVLSEDGQRLFFNSYDALLPRDTNGKVDVYEWEAASSEKECTELGAELYVPSSAGCLSLISSGESPDDSEFLDASPSGADVFFTTNASLLPQDPGLVDAYDARENGGLPPPPPPPAPCEGDACQNAVAPPNDPTPASASFRGAGNASVKKPRGRCAKGKARRKGRCVAKKQKRAKKRDRARQANPNRRAAR